jgi:hypothetical protein
MSDQLLAQIAPASRLLTAAEFHRLADVPPEVEWFANLSKPEHKTCLRERDPRLRAVHQHRPAGGIPHRDARSHRRLARRDSHTAVSAAAPSGTGSPRSLRCSNISASGTR